MDKLEQATRAFKEMAGKFGPAAFLEAKVLAVDETEYHADLETDEGLHLFDCRLRALISDNKSLDILPLVGSKVLVGKLADDDYYVMACDEIKSFRVTTGQTVFKMDDSGVVIQKGNETLKDILSSLVDEILKIYAPMNTPGFAMIKQRINSLLK